MDGFISLRQNPFAAVCDDTRKLDIQAFLKVAPKYVSRNVDVIEVIRLLHAYEYIPRDVHQNLTARYLSHQNTGSNRFSGLILELLTILRFCDIVRFLKTIGYDDFAFDLMRERYRENADVIQGACIGLSEEILTYYATLKGYMDDNVFHDRKAALEMRSNDLVASFGSFREIDEKQLAVNRFVVVTFLRATLYKTRTERETVLNDMIRNIPDDVDSRFANIVFNGKMGITAIRDNDDRAALEYVNTALKLCDNCEQQFVRVFAYHDQQYIFRCLQSASPNDEFMRNTLTSGQLGLDVLLNLANGKAMIWRKALTTENAMGLLKIKNNFAVMYDEPVSDGDRLAADSFIKSLDRNTGGSHEIRTAMKTALCKARINERTNRSLAQYYSEEAVKLARDGSHFSTDLVHISNYNDYLHSHTNVKCVG